MPHARSSSRTVVRGPVRRPRSDPCASCVPGRGACPCAGRRREADTRWWQAACSVLDPATGDAALRDHRRDRPVRRRRPRPRAAHRAVAAVAARGDGRHGVLHVERAHRPDLAGPRRCSAGSGCRPHTEMDLAGYLARLHPDDVALTRSVVERALADRQPFTYTHRLLLDGGAERYVRVLRARCSAPRPGRRPGCWARPATSPSRPATARSWPTSPTTTPSPASPTGAGSARGSPSAPRADGLRPAADRHRQLQGHQRPARPRGGRPGDPPGRPDDRDAARPDALLGRLGGDEFAVVVPDCDAAEALELAERLCDAVATTPMVAGLTAQRVTASFGVTTVGPGQDATRAWPRPTWRCTRPRRPGATGRACSPSSTTTRPSAGSRCCSGSATGWSTGRIELDAQPIVDLADRPGRAPRGADPAARRAGPAGRAGRVPARGRADGPGAAAGPLGARPGGPGAGRGAARGRAAAGGQHVGPVAGGRRAGRLDPRPR